jgi:hypothetical protein
MLERSRVRTYTFVDKREPSPNSLRDRADQLGSGGFASECSRMASELKMLQGCRELQEAWIGEKAGFPDSMRDSRRAVSGIGKCEMRSHFR